MNKKSRSETSEAREEVVQVGHRPTGSRQRFPVIVAVRFPLTNGMGDVARAAQAAGMKSAEWMRERLSACARAENAARERTRCNPSSQLPWLRR